MATRRSMRSVLLLAATLVVGAGCGGESQISPDDAVRVLRADFVAIEHMHATVFSTESWGHPCHLLTYPRGQFVTVDCNMANPSEYLVFDAQARDDYDRLLQAFEANGPRLTYAFVDYGDDGHIAEGTFELAADSDTWPAGYYVYKPGHAIRAETQHDSACSAPIGPDWYYTWGC